MATQHFIYSPAQTTLFVTYRRILATVLQIYRVSDSTWVALSTNPTAANCVIDLTEVGTSTGDYTWADPAGIDTATDEYIVVIQDNMGGAYSLNGTTNPVVGSGTVGAAEAVSNADITDIKDRVLLALPDAGPGAADGLLLLGDNEGQLNIENPNGDAVIFKSTGSDGRGFVVTGNGDGTGFAVAGGNTGRYGMTIVSNKINDTAAVGLRAYQADVGVGMHVDSDNLNGLMIGSKNMKTWFGNMTSLPFWLQLLGRGNPNAGALSEYNEDNGSGGGDFDPTTDTAHAISDSVTAAASETHDISNMVVLLWSDLNTGFSAGAKATNLAAVKTDTAAIKLKTDNLPSDPADASVIAGLIAAAQTAIDAVKAKTDNLPSDPADASIIAAAFVDLTAHGDANWEGSGGGPSDCGDALEDSVQEVLAAVLALSGSGDGSVVVDQDYGGVDNLSYLTEDDIGIDGAVIKAFLTSDWTAGNRENSYVKGETETDVNGHFVRPMLLDPAAYTLLYYKQGEYQASTKAITVS